VQPSQGGRGGGRGGRAVPRPYATQAAPDTLTGAESSATPPPGLSIEQWQTLHHMLGGAKPATTEKMASKDLLWIIDTGAINHMMGTLGALRDSKEIAPCPVGLPHGKDTIATKEGTIILNEDLSLENVLYVPELTCNLISVSQLTEQCDCFVQFTKTLCVIQGLTSKMLIGAGERRDRLYYFRGTPRINAMKTDCVVQFDLWHKRLGHPSMQVTKLVAGVNFKASKNKLNKNCEVCQKAKQSRDEFLVSEHKASAIFELVHCDLWDVTEQSLLVVHHIF